MTKHYVFTKCTGPIEGKDGYTICVRYHGFDNCIYHSRQEWRWVNSGNTVYSSDWQHIEVLTEVEGVDSPAPSNVSAEETLKSSYEHYKNVVKPDDSWASWEKCKEDGTVEMVLSAMHTHANSLEQECERLKAGLKMKVLDGQLEVVSGYIANIDIGKDSLEEVRNRLSADFQYLKQEANILYINNLK